MKNMKFDNNWMVETDYGSRAQLVYFKEFFGVLNLGSFTVKNHVGINNPFVTSTLSGLVNAVSTTSQFYAS